MPRFVFNFRRTLGNNGALKGHSGAFLKVMLTPMSIHHVHRFREVQSFNHSISRLTSFGSQVQETAQSWLE